MKKILLLLISVVMLPTLAGCGLPQNVKSQEKLVLEIAQSIPLPSTFYNTDTGHLMVAQPIKVEFMGTYATETGEPIFSVSFRYVDPHPYWWWYRSWHAIYVYWFTYDLVYPIANEPTQPVGVIWAFGSDGHQAAFMAQFTLQGLQNHKSELVWR